MPTPSACRLTALLLPLLLLTAGCSETRDAVSTATDCAAIAGDVAGAGLEGVPTQAEAEAAVRRLDERVQQLQAPAVRDAAGELRDRLRELQEAARAADPAAAQAAADRARQAAGEVAEACGVPIDVILGT